MKKPVVSQRSGPAAETGIAMFAPANRRRLSGPGLRTFLAIADLWGLTEEQRRLILGSPPRSTYHGWAKKVRRHQAITLSVDVLMRISAVLGIYKGLRILLADDHAVLAWLRTPHDAHSFGGAAPVVPSSDQLDWPPYEDGEIIFFG